MSKKCSACGKNIGYTKSYWDFQDGAIICNECYKQYKINEDEILNKIDENEEKKKLETEHLMEIKSLLRERKSLSDIETKIKKWKEEGYDVSELENMVEGSDNEY